MAEIWGCRSEYLSHDRKFLTALPLKSFLEPICHENLNFRKWKFKNCTLEKNRLTEMSYVEVLSQSVAPKSCFWFGSSLKLIFWYWGVYWGVDCVLPQSDVRCSCTKWLPAPIAEVHPWPSTTWNNWNSITCIWADNYFCVLGDHTSFKCHVSCVCQDLNMMPIYTQPVRAIPF